SLSLDLYLTLRFRLVEVSPSEYFIRYSVLNSGPFYRMRRTMRKNVEQRGGNLSMANDRFFTFHNGLKIPDIGFGTWQIPNEEAYAAVTTALKNGYTHIDTALAYQNEENVG